MYGLETGGFVADVFNSKPVKFCKHGLRRPAHQPLQTQMTICLSSAPWFLQTKPGADPGNSETGGRSSCGESATSRHRRDNLGECKIPLDRSLLIKIIPRRKGGPQPPRPP